MNWNKLEYSTTNSRFYNYLLLSLIVGSPLEKV